MILCLGEAIVDLVCEREVDSLAQATDFRPHFGGALANVAVAAARAGSKAGLAGGVGADAWGGWLRQRLEAEGVELEWFASVDGVATPVVFITFDRDREPAYVVYGEGIAATIGSLEQRLDDAIAASNALIFGSNTLVGERERMVTERARRLALDRGVPVFFDPNLRSHRWRDLDRARSLCREMARDATVVRANLEEGRWLSGRGGVPADQAADDIVELGARVAVVTRGAGGAVVRGEALGEHPGVEADVVSTLGAGDAFMGTLAAELAARNFDVTRAAETLAPACEAAAQVCSVWQAVP